MLEDYKRKRDFSKTPEPTAKKTPAKGDLKFVIQKHSARRLHYDVRLELDGVLMSWAVPKAPSLDPADKRLAVHTEDHPIDYDLFEGMIPMGEYGGGPMIIWDRGTYSPDDHGKTSWGDRDEAQKRLREGMKKGKISIFLRGEKLQGSWTLFRLGNREKDEWIMLKHKDEYVNPDRDVTKEDRSVVTGRTVEEIRANKPAAHPLVDPAHLPGSRAGRFPTEFTPMMASLTDGPFSQEGWVYEPKLDGIRAVAMIRGGKVSLWSRRGLDLSASYPSVVKELSAYRQDMIIDGEIVALDEKGRPSFQELQQRSGLTRSPDVKVAESRTPVFYYVFDILYLNGRNLENVKLRDRKALLKQTLVSTDRIRLVEPLAADGFTAYQACLDSGLEGVVAKRLDSVYDSGRRSKDWLKVKPTMAAEFVVCGYTEGTGSRGHTFGSLILGYYNRAGDLVYAGGCGTGFNEAKLQMLLKQFKKLEAKNSPFKEKVPGKQIHWLKPELVVEVKFAEWTKDSKVRAPVFMRVRDDKPPEACTRDEIVHEVKEQKPEEPIVHKHDVIDLDKRRTEKTRKKADDSGDFGIDQKVLSQLENAGDKLLLEVDGSTISFTNLNKQFWPGTDEHEPLTKRDYAIYLTKVAPWILPHMKDRPITFVRFPHGIKGGKFYQKHWEKGLPDFVERTSIFVEHVKTAQEYIVCNNLPTLLWLAQIADLEIHTWQSRIKPGPDGQGRSLDFGSSLAALEESLLNFPDYLLFDLDPYIYSGKESHGDEPELNIEGFRQCARLAKWLKDIFDTVGIEAFIKTTGKTGLHIYIPIVREFTFDEVRALSDAIGRVVLKQHPNDVTMDWAVVKRTGKTFLDHNMNARGKTLASIYSVRVSPEAAVSVPIRWDQIDDIYPTDFTMRSVPELLKVQGDLWADILDHKNDLRKLITKTQGEGKPAANKSRRRKSS
jgi:bifunctional non-homologous end joining protein LigD